MRTYTHRKPHSFKKVRQNLLPSNTINTAFFGNGRGWEGLKSLFLVNECQFDISTGFWYTVIVKARFARAYFFERRPSGFFPPPFPIFSKNAGFSFVPIKPQNNEDLPIYRKCRLNLLFGFLSFSFAMFLCLGGEETCLTWLGDANTDDDFARVSKNWNAAQNGQDNIVCMFVCLVSWSLWCPEYSFPNTDSSGFDNPNRSPREFYS